MTLLRISFRRGLFPRLIEIVTSPFFFEWTRLPSPSEIMTAGIEMKLFINFRFPIIWAVAPESKITSSFSIRPDRAISACSPSPSSS